MHQYDIRDLRIHFPTRRGVVEAVRGVSFYMDQGECVALVGESGAGKSTILNLVIGFNQAESGKVLIDGKDISKIDLRTYRKHLAVVPQTSRTSSITARSSGRAIGAGTPP